MSSKGCFINIIILNYNGKNDTIECLDSIAQNTSLPQIKILLINNSPSEKFTPSELSQYPFTIDYIPLSENKGFCGGNNVGITQSLTDPNCAFIMLLNNDTIVPDDMIQTLRSRCEDTPTQILNPIIVFSDSHKIQCTGGKWSVLSGLARNYNKGKLSAQITTDITPDYLSGCCIFAHRDAFDDIGVLDEDFFTYCEDMDFSRRAQKKGYTLQVVKDAVLYHKHSQGSSSPVKVYLICRNTVLFMRKHFPLLLPVLIPIHYLFQLAVGFVIHKIRNIFILFKIVTVGFMDGIRNKWSLEKIRKIGR